MRVSIITPRKKDENQHVLHAVQHRQGQKYDILALIKDCIFLASKDFRYHDELWIEILVESQEEKLNESLRLQIHSLLDKFKKQGEWWGYPVLRVIDLIVL